MSKTDSERKKFYSAKIHKKKDFLHVHLSKELRSKIKKRAILPQKGDKIKIMRGNAKGKTGKIISVNYTKIKLYIEGISRKNLRGREIRLPIQPSNVMLIERRERTDVPLQPEKTEKVQNKKDQEKPKAEEPVHVDSKVISNG